MKSGLAERFRSLINIAVNGGELARELIETRGFSFVAAEADWPDAARVDDYVRGGKRRSSLAAIERLGRALPTGLFSGKAMERRLARLLPAYWNALTADGGVEQPCGWLKDKFGLSWQVVPRRFVEIATHTLPDSLPFEIAALAEPLACVLHGLETSALEKASAWMPQTSLSFSAISRLMA